MAAFAPPLGTEVLLMARTAASLVEIDGGRGHLRSASHPHEHRRFCNSGAHMASRGIPNRWLGIPGDQESASSTCQPGFRRFSRESNAPDSTIRVLLSDILITPSEWDSFHISFCLPTPRVDHHHSVSRPGSPCQYRHPNHWRDRIATPHRPLAMKPNSSCREKIERCLMLLRATRLRRSSLNRGLRNSLTF